jgi:PEP-CTERM motif
MFRSLFKTVSVLSMAAILGGVAAPQSFGNLVLNPDFEIDNGVDGFPADWFRGGPVAPVLGDDSDGVGTRSVAITGPGGDWRAPAFEVTAGTAFDFSFDTKFLSGTTGEIFTYVRYFSDPFGLTWMDQAWMPVAAGSLDAWTPNSASLVVPAGAQSADVWITTAFSPLSGEVRLDNVVVTPEPGALALLGLGSLVGLVRRRRN